MRPTLSLFSKASRLPLTSKRGNKDFYKGTRTGNIMKRQRIAQADRFTGRQFYDEFGRPNTWTMMTREIDESKVTSYIVPPGLAETKLKPLVFLGKSKEGGVEETPQRGYPGADKMGSGFSFNGRYYERLRQDIEERHGGRSRD